MSCLYIQVYRKSNKAYYVSLESLITIFVYKLCESEVIKLYVKFEEDIHLEPLILVDFSNISYHILEKIPSTTKYCKWPVIVNELSTVAGLSAVCRKIIKNSNNDVRKLLGFREACLMACNESSIWTKFCEIDMVCTIKKFLKNPSKYCNNNKLPLPNDFVRFEYHMEQPVQAHNIYKLVRIVNGEKSIKSSVPLCDLKLEHLFSEGPQMTLADILLFPCFKLFFQIVEAKVLEDYLPLLLKWYHNMENQSLIPEVHFQTQELNCGILFDNLKVSIKQDIPRQSLYISDPSRYKPQSRIYTKQEDIENILSFINTSNLMISSNPESFYDDVEFDWSKIHFEASPFSGALPEKRASRKAEQLENLAKAAVKLAGDSPLKIVDFCSGSGHLGILIATLLPNCKIILVENKERSLERAIERVTKMNLKNVSFLQCNLDYFEADFDIGLALHACGVATDLVIQCCIQKSAHFICCPCCYGGIHNCHHISYPKSKKFIGAGVNYKDFLILSHAADQTHNDDSVKTPQGYLCMNIVDCDRKFYAEEFGYKVYLGKLKPITCTPKNNILIGIKEKCN